MGRLWDKHYEAHAPDQSTDEINKDPDRDAQNQ
jgi:hypothetical protein